LPEAYIAQGENLLILGKTDDALKALALFLDKNDKHVSAAQAFFLKGKALYGTKKYDDALEAFGEATRRTKSEVAAQAQFYIGQIHQGREDFKAAILDYLRIPALYPEAREWIAASTFESAKCSEALGQKDDARKAFQDLVDNYKDTKWAGLAADRLK
jgi:TolA-binding protein